MEAKSPDAELHHSPSWSNSPYTAWRCVLGHCPVEKQMIVPLSANPHVANTPHFSGLVCSFSTHPLYTRVKRRRFRHADTLSELPQAWLLTGAKHHQKR